MLKNLFNWPHSYPLLHKESLIRINEKIRYHEVEIIGEELRDEMDAMKAII